MTVTSLSTTLPEVPTNLKIHTDSIKTSTLLTLASTATLNPDQVDVSETPTTTSSPASMNLADEITRLKSEMRDAKEASQSVEARLGETLRTLEKGHEERMKAKDEQHVAEMTALEAKLCQKVSNVEEELVAVKAEYERKLEAAMNQNQELCKKVAAITAELQDTTKEASRHQEGREEEMASHGAMIVERERRIGGLKEALEKRRWNVYVQLR
ncbi:hypothetical protein BC829DRAFT_104194 [Chytridium lagenaria]|nr:hypothetical protein BC829DRAFT_104194 [Chytridium lagenaria]